jgi:signal peptidase
MKRVIVVLGLILAAQVVYFLLPVWLIVPFNRIARPAVYAAALTIALVFGDGMGRPAPKRDVALLVSVFGVLMYYAAMLITGIVTGFGMNPMVPGLWAVFVNLWVYGSIVVMSEYLRVRVIKEASRRGSSTVAVAVTLVYTFAQIGNIRGIDGLASFGSFFVVTVSPLLTLNAVLSYMSFESRFSSVLILRSVYSLSLVLLPFIPMTTDAVWATVSSTVLFVTVVIYNIFTAGGKRGEIAKKRAKYKDKTILSYRRHFFSVVSASVTAAFMLGAFTYFPVTVVSGSMSGAFERGAVAIVEKLRPEDIFVTLNTGDIIYFRQGNINVIHRIIDFRYDQAGERVYITKGDANPTADVNPVEQGQIIGVMRSFVPHIGSPVVYINSILGR